MSDPDTLARAAAAMPSTARDLLWRAYSHPQWTKVRVSVQSSIRAGFWTTQRAARENLEAMRGRGLIHPKGNAQFALVEDPDARAAIIQALEARTLSTVKEDL